MKTPPIGLWNVDAAIEPLPGGHRNIAFRTSGLDQDLVFKTTRRSEDALRWLIPVWDAVEHAGCAVPRLMTSRNGVFCEQGWTCEPYFRGTHLPSDKMTTLMPIIKQMHLACATLPQRPGFSSATDLITRNSGGDVDLTTMPQDLVATCRTHWAGLTDLAETAIHADITPTNTLALPDGRIALLDWDEARKDAAIFDLGPLGAGEHKLARLAWEVACSWTLEPDHAKRLAAYLQR